MQQLYKTFLCALSQRIHYTNCPVCNSINIAAVLKAKDYTVSKEIFEVWECIDCTLRFTQNVPDAFHIAAYYESADYISHSNTSKGFVNKLYHTVRYFTLNSKKNFVEKFCNKESKNLLDVGAGTGAFAATMQKAGWNVTALEPDKTARENAKKELNISPYPSEELFNLKPASFNVITLWHVLEHVHDLHNYINTFFSLLKDKGCLIIAVPNYTAYDAREYSASWAAYDVPRHLYHFSPASMKVLLEKHNLFIKEYKPMWFDSYYISLLSEKYLTGKSNPVKAFISGSISNFNALENKLKSSSIIYVVKK